MKRATERQGGQWSEDAGAQSTISKMVDAAAIAFASTIVLGSGFALGGYMYHKFYKWLVLHKMENAFKPGDPVLELAASAKQWLASEGSPKDNHEQHWIVRDEQLKID
jgi:hypothetical protein